KKQAATFCIEMASAERHQETLARLESSEKGLLEKEAQARLAATFLKVKWRARFKTCGKTPARFAAP
ncbi:hypothetical protein, partial [Cronobacter sakazakii]|uniref:hypothetical protein n=1 Tax=Cronobacter sakazakii TaxID=28141 RepID=UPI001593EE25